MHELTKLIQITVQNLFNETAEVELTRTDEQFGDYATNVALRLSKKLEQNPREIATQITEALESDHIAKAEVAGPGFINITLTENALVALAESPHSTTIQPQSVVIETNNPNPFKAMHIGHAFNAIIADTVANILEASGDAIYRVSYHGDVGLHVGKSMYSLLKFVDGSPQKLQEVTPELRNNFMSKMYAEGAKAYKEDESAKAEIDELTKQSFTREDPVYAAVYDTCKDWSFELIDQTVARLGNKPVERRFLESDADVRGVKIVKDNVPKVFQESDGALVFAGSKYGSFDNAFVTSRGLGLYGARDLGLMQLKNEYYHPKKSYIVTAEEQKDYFKGVIAAAELCLPDLKNVTVNISTGTVKLSTGKMSSRDGDVLEISWLFDQIAAAIKERGNEPTDESIAGSLRYQFLKVRIGSDVVFDVNEAVSLQGNSGPYLQYAHARACSILQKSSQEPADLQQLDTAERSLLRKISEYNEVVNRAQVELMPHHVCTYLYELAQTFNRFYEQSRVIDDPREAIRINLVSKYAQTLKNGLDLLGIHAPEKM
jgi:arginyl-tRNA synthetase